MYQSQNELYHHGILGMKWGVRRYQNKDGSLTPAGRKRADELADEYSKTTSERKAKKLSIAYEKTTGRNISDHESIPRQKKLAEMTNQEIQAKIDRLKLEQTLASLTPKQISNGEKFVNYVKDKGVYAFDTLYEKALVPYMEKKVKDALGLGPSDTDKISAKLKREAQDWENRSKIAKNKKSAYDSQEALAKAQAAKAAREKAAREKAAKAQAAKAAREQAAGEKKTVRKARRMAKPNIGPELRRIGN